MLSYTQLAVSADERQAEYFREFLEQERLDLVARQAAHTRLLTKCMTTGDKNRIGDERRAIRHVEKDLRAIDRMLAALMARFPEACGVFQRA